jgi:hypothetical protein
MHIDNPKFEKGHILTSGVRLHTTKKLRTHEAGCLVLGDRTTSFPPIPPGLSRVHYESTCTTECTDTFGGKVEVFATYLHAHYYGREIWTVLNRKGSTKNSEVVNYKQFWNFGFQNVALINYTIFPGDSLSTHCVYDSSKSAANITFGLQSSEEMCMVSGFPFMGKCAECILTLIKC